MEKRTYLRYYSWLKCLRNMHLFAFCADYLLTEQTYQESVFRTKWLIITSYIAWHSSHYWLLYSGLIAQSPMILGKLTKATFKACKMEVWSHQQAQSTGLSSPSEQHLEVPESHRTTESTSTYFSQALCHLYYLLFLHQTLDYWANCVLREQLKAKKSVNKH